MSKKGSRGGRPGGCKKCQGIGKKVVNQGKSNEYVKDCTACNGTGLERKTR